MCKIISFVLSKQVSNPFPCKETTENTIFPLKLTIYYSFFFSAKFPGLLIV